MIWRIRQEPQGKQKHLYVGNEPSPEMRMKKCKSGADIKSIQNRLPQTGSTTNKTLFISSLCLYNAYNAMQYATLLQFLHRLVPILLPEQCPSLRIVSYRFVLPSLLLALGRFPSVRSTTRRDDPTSPRLHPIFTKHLFRPSRLIRDIELTLSNTPNNSVLD